MQISSSQKGASQRVCVANANPRSSDEMNFHRRAHTSVKLSPVWFCVASAISAYVASTPTAASATDLAAGSWVVTGEETLYGDTTPEDFSAIQIASGATLRVAEDSFFPSFNRVTVNTGGTLDIRASENAWEEDEVGVPGTLELAAGSRLQLDAAGILTTGRTVTSGADIVVSGTARGEAFEDAQQNVLGMSTLKLTQGDTHIRVGGADRFGFATDAVIPFGRSRVAFEALDMAADARLVVEIGNGGRVHWGADPWTANSDQYGDMERHPDAGTLMISGAATITPNMYWTVGETATSAWQRGQNLLVVRDGIVELNGTDAKLDFAPGTRVTFEAGAVLWITTESSNTRAANSSNGTLPDEGVLWQLDLSNAQVMGLGNLSILYGEEQQELYFTVNEAGQIAYMLRPPAFEGPFQPILEALWANRKTPIEFYRNFFVQTSPAVAGKHLAAIASATTMNGTRERMAAAGVERSMALSDMVRAMELQGSVPQKTNKEDKEGVIARRMPEVLKSVPLFLDVATGRARVRANAPAAGLARRATSDETTVRAGFLLGKGDWRFGLEGLFMDTDFRESRAGSSLVLTKGSSEMTGVTLFSRYRANDTEWIADVSWLEAVDKVGVPILRESVTTDDAKRTLWSVGSFLKRTVVGTTGAENDWGLTVFGGMRGWWWRDAKAHWEAKGGEILCTNEKGGLGVTGTLGTGIEGGQKLRSDWAPNFLAAYLPTRIDGGVRAALHAGHFPGGHMAVSLPTGMGATDVTVDMPIEKSSNFRASADVSLGLQFPETRVELTASTLTAGRRYRAQSLSARLVWRY